jgi:hypothetical protein
VAEKVLENPKIENQLAHQASIDIKSSSDENQLLSEASVAVVKNSSFGSVIKDLKTASQTAPAKPKSAYVSAKVRSEWAESLETAGQLAPVNASVVPLVQNNWLGGYHLPNPKQQLMVGEMLDVLKRAETAYRSKMGDKTLCLPPREAAYALYKYLFRRSNQEGTPSFDAGKYRKSYEIMIRSLKDIIDYDKQFNSEIYNEMISKSFPDRTMTNPGGPHSLAMKLIRGVEQQAQEQVAPTPSPGS